MVYSCNDAWDDIANAMMKQICSRCNKKSKCWKCGEPDFETLTGCVISAIYAHARDKDDAPQVS